MAKAKKKTTKKLVSVDEPKNGRPLPRFDARELAKTISDSINKGKKAKNVRDRPVRSGADADNADIVRYISMGTSALDAATGGGFPCGRVSMVYGLPSSGKSLLSESAILSAQQREGVGCIIDSEHTFNKARFSAKGGVIRDVLFIDAKTLEDGFKDVLATIETLCAAPSLIDKPVVIVWDTINTNQTANKASDNQYAAGMMEAPRVIWDGFRRVTEIISKSNVAFVVLNQVYGDKVPPGGKGLQYYSSQITYLEEDERYFSYRTGKWGKILKAELMKNKSNPPLDDLVYFCCDSMGVDDTMSIYYNLKPRGVGSKIVDPGVFKKAGSWSSYFIGGKEEDKVAWQGDKGFYLKCLEVPELVEELAAELWKLWPPADPAIIEADSEFVEFFKRDNPWVVEDEAYANCLISDHMCPIGTWKTCRASYWTECAIKLDDVETLSRVYHEPPNYDASAVLGNLPDEPEPEED